MRKILFTLLVLANCLLMAQESDIEELIFSMWPEYDHPGILVIVSGKINPDKLPFSLEFAVPDEAEEVQSAGVLDTTSKMIPVQLVSRADEKWVQVDLTNPKFHFEFYYDPFSDDHDRNVAYNLKFGHDIPSYMLALQQPFAAEDFTMQENDMESFQDQHGMTFFRKLMPGLKSGESKLIQFSYGNHTGETSIDQLRKMMAGNTQGAGTPGMPPAAQSIERHKLPLLEPLVLLFVVAVVVGIMFYRYKKNEVPVTPVASTKISAKENFCSQCGTVVKKQDKFCANCGEKLNVSGSA